MSKNGCDVNIESALDVILEQLSVFGGYQKSTSTSRMVCCPFHEEKTPSCGISIIKDSKIPLGYFNCFGCAEKGPWNKFADKSGLKKIKDWQISIVGDERINIKQSDSELLPRFESSIFDSICSLLNNNEVFPWPERNMWRTYKGELIKKLHGHTFVDRYEDELMLALPVTINNKVRGVIKARIKKADGMLSYITSNGAWVKKYGLFPFDIAKSMVKDYIVVVEGPRDSLRLIINGIPSVAILGAKSFSKNKAMLLSSTGVSHVYIMPDNDRGGNIMYKTVASVLRDAGINYSRIALPSYTSSGKKMDPNSTPKNLMKRIKKFLREKHG